MTLRKLYVDGPWDGETRNKIEADGSLPVVEDVVSEPDSETMHTDWYVLVTVTQQGTAIYAHRRPNGESRPTEHVR